MDLEIDVEDKSKNKSYILFWLHLASYICIYVIENMITDMTAAIIEIRSICVRICI